VVLDLGQAATRRPERECGIGEHVVFFEYISHNGPKVPQGRQGCMNYALELLHLKMRKES